MSAVLQVSVPLVRSMVSNDVDAVIEVEHSSYDFPWSAELFHDCLRVGYHCLVAEVDQRIVGFTVFSCAVEEAHLLNLCVDPRYRKHGIGSLLLGRIFDQAISERCRELFLEVRPSNEPAIGLYRRFGFRSIGTRPDYYRAVEGREDAFVLAASLQARSGDSVFLDFPGNKQPSRH